MRVLFVIKGDPFRGTLHFVKPKKTVYCHSKEHSLIFENQLFEMLAVATSQKAHPLNPIFDDWFKHFDW